MEGKKDDKNKVRLDLVPADAIYAIARGLTDGERKYGIHNWRKGIKHSRLYAAAMRHMSAYWEGETYDPKSGLSHMDHAITNLAMLVSTKHPDADDRWSADVPPMAFSLCDLTEDEDGPIRKNGHNYRCKETPIEKDDLSIADQLREEQKIR